MGWRRPHEASGLTSGSDHRHINLPVELERRTGKLLGDRAPYPLRFLGQRDGARLAQVRSDAQVFGMDLEGGTDCRGESTGCRTSHRWDHERRIVEGLEALYQRDGVELSRRSS